MTDTNDVSPSEALYAFIEQFRKSQGWTEPRDGWIERLKPYPKDEQDCP